MVLKVVTGKILETLELRWFPAARSSVLDTRPRGATEARLFAFTTIDRAQPLGSALTVRLSKIVDYLIDNLRLSILSRVGACGQEKNGRAADPVPIRDCRTRPVCRECV